MREDELQELRRLNKLATDHLVLYAKENAALIQRAEAAEALHRDAMLSLGKHVTSLRQIRDVLPAERAREIADLLGSRTDYLSPPCKQLLAYAALLERLTLFASASIAVKKGASK